MADQHRPWRSQTRDHSMILVIPQSSRSRGRDSVPGNPRPLELAFIKSSLKPCETILFFSLPSFVLFLFCFCRSGWSPCSFVLSSLSSTLSLSPGTVPRTPTWCRSQRIPHPRLSFLVHNPPEVLLFYLVSSPTLVLFWNPPVFKHVLLPRNLCWFSLPPVLHKLHNSSSTYR